MKKKQTYLIFSILLLFFLGSILFCLFYQKTKKHVSTLGSIPIISETAIKKGAPVPQKRIQNQTMPKWIYQVNQILQQNENTPILLKTNISSLKKIKKHPLSSSYKKREYSQKTNSFAKDRKNVPTVGFVQCGGNPFRPDSLSQKLTNTNSKNNQKESGSPFENINCGFIQTSFPISF